MKLKMHVSCYIDTLRGVPSRLIHLCAGKDKVMVTWNTAPGPMGIKEPVRCRRCKVNLLEMVP